MTFPRLIGVEGSRGAAGLWAGSIYLESWLLMPSCPTSVQGKFCREIGWLQRVFIMIIFLQEVKRLITDWRQPCMRASSSNLSSSAQIWVSFVCLHSRYTLFLECNLSLPCRLTDTCSSMYSRIIASLTSYSNLE